MKVCKVEDFPGDKIECKNCPEFVVKFNGIFCRIMIFKDGYDIEYSYAAERGCRHDCPLIPCEGIKEFLVTMRDLTDINGKPFLPDGLNDDSIKFIKACEDNQ